MKRNSYWPIRKGDQIIWLVNWVNKLPGYAIALGLTPAQITAAIADALWLIYVLQEWQGAVKAFLLACTAAANTAQTGDGTAVMTLPVFTPPALPAGGTPVNTGALYRTFALVQTIKDSPGRTDAIEADLRIVGSAQQGPDYDTVAPKFIVSLTPAGVFLDWDFGGFAAFLDMIDFEVDRGDGKGWVPLNSDSTPGYTDTFPQPTAPIRWKYRAIYRLGDQRVGKWSAEMSIIVGGV